MKKVKKKEYNLKKERAKASAKATLEELQGISADTIINNIYFQYETEFEFFLIKEIEKQLVLANIDENRYKLNIYTFYKSISNEIKRNGKFQEFADFCYKAYYILETKFKVHSVEHHIAVAYYNTLIEISTYLVEDNHFIYGITTKNKPMQKRELYPFADKILYEVTEEAKAKGTNDIAIVTKHFRKYGYENINSMEDIEMMFHEERTIVNMHFSTAFLIDENSESIIKTPYALAYTGWLKVKPSLTIDDCTRLLKERKRLLPKQGVYLTNISNSNIEEVYLLEKFALDKLFLMYRIKMDGRYFIGYYDIMQNFFYSLYKDCSLPEAQVVNFKIENFILELYSIMTTEVESNIDFVSSIENDEVDIKGNKTYNVYNRNDYDNTIKHVEAYIRKLPLGAVASDESKKLAERYGIKLGINETFVRAFDKSVRTKKDKN